MNVNEPIEIEQHFIFKGNVQGVGFRAKAFRFANELNLKGYAKNLSDGTVSIILQGEEKDVLFFVEKLKSYFGKNISEVSVLSKSLSTGYFQNFEIV